MPSMVFIQTIMLMLYSTVAISIAAWLLDIFGSPCAPKAYTFMLYWYLGHMATMVGIIGATGFLELVG